MGALITRMCPWLSFGTNEEPEDFEMNNKITDEVTGEYTRLGNDEKVEDLDDINNLQIKASNLVFERNCRPSEVYENVKELGSGSFGTVNKVKHKITGAFRAMKIISKASANEGVDPSEIEKEIDILKQLDHPNILKIYEFFQDDVNYYIITELCENGELFDELNRKGKMNESAVKSLMIQILSAVAYLHSKGVIHGDLKLENILIDSYDFRKDMTTYDVKLIDFGCSRVFPKGKAKMLKGLTGTSLYCAPEVINEKYNEKCDIWACGVIMYILLCGYEPFSGESDEEIFEEIKKGVVSFDSSEFEDVTKDAKDMVKLLLTYDQNKRVSAKEALMQPFFIKNRSSVISKDPLDPQILANLSKVKDSNKFQQAVLAYISHNFADPVEVNKLKKLFREFDIDSDGVITKEEMINGYKILGRDISEDTVNGIIKMIDNDGNGLIEFEEFIRHYHNKELLLTEDNLKLAFDLFDNDKNGTISCNEIKAIVFGNHVVHENIISDFLTQIGKKEEESITFEEFQDVMNKLKEK